jgi:hypothetical protein
MAFGQQSGPPATARQLQELLALLQQAGHADFRDARGPLGFTQRQGNGKFTRDEAEALIEQLQAELDAAEASSDPGFDSGTKTDTDGAEAMRPRKPAPSPPSARLSSAEQALRRMPTERLAAELQRRGWIVVEP